MIAVIDYGMGNLRSVEKALQFAGFDAQITSDIKKIKDASHLVLPGVGAIKDAVTSLNEKGLTDVIHSEVKKGKPFLGICLGMQLLFERSYENGLYDCLNLIPGEVVPFKVEGLKVPHMGWNSIDIKEQTLFEKTEKAPYVYFVHSYHAASVPEQYIAATANYGYDFCAAVKRDNVMGTQFHPEKSGDFGISIITRFGSL